MNFNMIPKENPRNRFLEHCVNEGNNFEVEIVHWRMIDNPAQAVELNGIMGNECWNVYATIKQGHPLFDRLRDIETDDYCGAMNKFPFAFHCGITYVHNNGDNIKVGDDYLHYGDEVVQRCSELPGEVKYEAKELFKFLEGAK
jgi:hypothetical protein